MARPFEVALVGRPNVGKSTLFNRLVGRRLALVDDRPGVTRDRRSGEARIGGLAFTIVDTAGLAEAPSESLEGRMTQQTEAAIRAADMAVFMVDARAGITPTDRTFAELLRRTGKPVVLVANKAEGRGGESGALEAYALGLGDPIAISAEHGEGLGDLHDAIAARMTAAGQSVLPDDEEVDDDDQAGDKAMKVAIVGRPNAGKSTLVNKLIGEDRLLTGPEAGLTRDSIAVDWSWGGSLFRLYDTAGLRRKARVQEKLEKLSVGDALRAIRFAELVIIVIDATKPFDKQDLHIADLIEREGRAAVIAVNKWDLVEDTRTTQAEIREAATRLLPQFRSIPLVPISAERGTGLDKLMKAVEDTYAIWNRRVSTAALNRWLADALADHSPPAAAGRRIKLRYITQAKARPPTFVVFCSRPEQLPDSYRRYLTNSIAEHFEMAGVPIRLMLRKGENPYANRG